MLPISYARLATEPEGAEFQEPVTVQRFNVAVMTQTCDLLRFVDDEEVILCPRFDYLQIAEERPSLKGKGGWKALVAERVIGSYLMTRCQLDGHTFDYQVIDLRTVFSLGYSVVRAIAESTRERIRLLPPYREHLGQAFARQFMRVGLPRDLPREYPY